MKKGTILNKAIIYLSFFSLVNIVIAILFVVDPASLENYVKIFMYIYYAMIILYISVVIYECYYQKLVDKRLYFIMTGFTLVTTIANCLVFILI